MPSVVVPSLGGGSSGSVSAHASTHATGGTDAVSPGSIGAATAAALTALDGTLAAHVAASPGHVLTEAYVRGVLATSAATLNINSQPLAGALSLSGPVAGGGVVAALAPDASLPADGTGLARWARRAGHDRLQVAESTGQWRDVARDLFAHEFDVLPTPTGTVNGATIQGPGTTVLAATYARGLELATIGTVTSPDPVGGDVQTDEPYFEIVSPTGTRQYATIYSGRANATGRGVFSRGAGFHVFWDVSPRTNAANKSYAFGLWARLDGGTDAPATRPNGFGLVSQGAAGSNYQIVSRDGASGIAPIDTGLPRNATDRLRFELFAVPNALWVGYRLTSVTTGAVVAEGRIAGTLPALATMLVMECTAETGSVTTTAVTLRVFRVRGRWGRPKF